MTPNGSNHVGLDKYEILTNFCLLCGVIGHRYLICALEKEEDKDIKDMQYGPWMGG